MSVEQPVAPTAARRQILLVAGSGRSGTSLFTGLAGRLGLHVPQPEVTANETNPRGFGEPQWLVDFHEELLASADVMVVDGRPEAWELTDRLADDAEALDRLAEWLEVELSASGRIVLKDPRLAWFVRLHRRAAERVGADLRLATMLRHPAEVMRSRELAYGSNASPTARTVGWVTIMLGIEQRSRSLPRAMVRYDDLMADWRSTLGAADATLRLGLVDGARDQRLAEAGTLVDPTLHRSSAGWDDLAVPPRLLDLTVRTYDALGDMVDAAETAHLAAHAELDALSVELRAYYDECAEVAVSRASAKARAEKRKVARRLRRKLREATESGRA
jgi:hypothetical protein